MRRSHSAGPSSVTDPDVTALVCPRCVLPMFRQLRGQIEVDVCRVCKGVWLDHGELNALTNVALVEEQYERDLADDGDLDLLPTRVVPLPPRHHDAVVPRRRR